MADAAQYAIDVAARMTGTETFAQLDELTASLSHSGKGAEHFSAAMQTISNDLRAAGAASQAANAALADGQAKYRDLEGALSRAVRAAEQAPVKLAAAQRTLEAAQNALTVAQSSGAGEEQIRGYELALKRAAAAVARLSDAASTAKLAANVEQAQAAVDEYAVTLHGLEQAAASAAKREEQLSASLGNVRTMASHVDKRLGQASEGLAKIQAGLSASGTSAGRLGSRLIAPVKGFADLSQVIGTGNAAMLLAASAAAAAALAVVALGAAAVVGVAAIAKWAIGLASARRDAGLLAAAADAADPSLAALRGTIGGLERTTMVSGASLQGLAKSLSEAGVSASELPAALRAAALAESALGQGGAAQYVEQIKAGKLAVKDFARDAQRNFGGIVAKQMTSTAGLARQLQANVGDIFGGLNIEPVLNGLQTLVNLLDQNSATGRAVKTVFASVFQPLINQAQLAAWAVEAFALGIGIGVLKAYIAVRPTIAKIAALFDIDTSGFDLESSLASIAKAGEMLAPVIIVLAAGTGVLVAALAGVAAVAGGVLAAAFISAGNALRVLWNTTAPVRAAIEALAGVAKSAGSAVLAGFSGAIDQATSFLRGVSLAPIGADLIAGLVAGITGGASAVANAMTNVAKGALTAAKTALGIASPSRPMIELGHYTGAGAVVGLERETPHVQAAMAAMVEPPPPSASPTVTAGASAFAGASSAVAPAAAPAGGPSITVNIGAGAVVVQAAQDVNETVERVGDAVRRLFEAAAVQLVGEVPA